MKKNVFITGIKPRETKESKNKVEYQIQEIMVGWRETREDGFIQDHSLQITLRGESLNLFTTLAYKVGDEITLDFTFNASYSMRTGQTYNQINAMLYESL